MVQKGLKFELLTKAIYEEILALDDFATIEVKHDVKIMGKSGQKHQVDVFWEFECGSVTHRVAVECKDYSSKVSVGKLRDFFGVLEDIGNIQGVFVTTTGYQSGAKTYANSKGISLKTVKSGAQNNIDELGLLKTLIVNGTIKCIGNVTVTPIFDIDWILENTDMGMGDEINLGAPRNEMFVQNFLGTISKSIYDYENELPRKSENLTGLTKLYKFTDKFLYVPSSEYPPLKLMMLHFKYDTYASTETYQYETKVAAEAILKDIITDKFHLYKKNLKTASN